MCSARLTFSERVMGLPDDTVSLEGPPIEYDLNPYTLHWPKDSLTLFDTGKLLPQVNNWRHQIGGRLWRTALILYYPARRGWGWG